MPADLPSTLGRLRYDGLPAGSPAAYLFAVVCVVAAGLAHFAFAHFTNDMTPSVPYYPAIFVAALFGGARAGIIALVLSAVVIWWAIDTHYFGHHTTALTRAVNRGLYVTAAVLVVWVADRYRRAGRDRDPPAETASAPTGARVAATSGPAGPGLPLRQWWRDGLAPNSLAAYGFALACIAAATFVRFGFGWLGGDVLPFASYYPAILIASLIGGVEAGLFAMMLSMVAAWWTLVSHHGSAGMPTRDEFVSFALYLFASLLTVWLAESYRHAPRRLHAQKSTLVEFIAPVVVSLAAVLLTTVVLFTIDSYLAAQHLVLGYLLPTVLIAIYYGSTIAVLTSFASGLAAAYILFPPKFSFYVANPLHVAELGFFMLLAVIASKAISVLTDDIRRQRNRAFRNRGR
jgi:K+-sensing histidine kinase KdpD